MCAFEFSPHFFLYSCDWSERLPVRTHTHACPFVVCSMFTLSHALSLFRPLFISLPKYNGNTFTMFSFDMVLCLHIYVFRAFQKAHITMVTHTHARPLTHTIRVQHILIQNQTPTKQIQRIWICILIPRMKFVVIVFVVDGSIVFLYCNDNPPRKQKRKHNPCLCSISFCITSYTIFKRMCV